VHDVLRTSVQSWQSGGGDRGLAQGAATGPRIRVESVGFPTAFIRPDDLRSVLGHLFENALQAMGGVENPKLEVMVESDPIHARILVHDTGHGIPIDRWETIFQPGFTTKKSGDHGHGLSICRERLAPFRGSLRVLDSKPGVGTTMEIRLETVAPSDLTALPAAEMGGR
jgi:signal transduction histidine kinase